MAKQPSMTALAELKLPSMGKVLVPEYLHEDAQACIEVITESVPDGLLTRVDSYLLASYACAVAVHKRCAHEMCRPDFQWVEISEQTGTGKPSSWVRMMFDAGNQIAKIGARLGLDPISRESVLLPRKFDLHGEFAGLIGRP